MFSPAETVYVLTGAVKQNTPLAATMTSALHDSNERVVACSILRLIAHEVFERIRRPAQAGRIQKGVFASRNISDILV
jgi:hypothetical protein